MCPIVEYSDPEMQTDRLAPDYPIALMMLRPRSAAGECQPLTIHFTEGASQ